MNVLPRQWLQMHPRGASYDPLKLAFMDRPFRLCLLSAVWSTDAFFLLPWEFVLLLASAITYSFFFVNFRARIDVLSLSFALSLVRRCLPSCVSRSSLSVCAFVLRSFAASC